MSDKPSSGTEAATGETGAAIEAPTGTEPATAAPDVLSRPLRRRVEEIVSIGVTAAAAEPARFAGAPFAPRHCDNPNTARAALAGLVVAAEALVVEERS